MPESAVAFNVQRLAGCVPACLRERAHWVGWTYVERDGKATKCPISPTKGGKASATDPATWGTFEQAIAACQAAGLEGVGFVFSADDPFAGVDLDKCIDPTSGQPKLWAQAILDRFDSYSEVSPSGTGVKIFVRARKPGPRCKTGHADGAIEMYDRDRFFTVTGQSLHDPPRDVGERQAAFDDLYAQVFGPVASVPTPPPDPSNNGDVRLEDDEIIRLACASKKSGAKFASLWAGRWNDHFNSRSEADSSVIFTLALYTKDAGQIDRIFRRSGLMRDKWDEAHGQQTYGEMTIAKALATVTGQYRPRKSSKNSAPKSAAIPPTPPPSSGRPQIQGNERQLRDIRNDALAALYAANRPPRLFHRAGGIARVAFLQHEHDGTVPRVQQLDADALRGELTNVADWYTLKHGRQGDFLNPDLPPLAIARDILTQPMLDLPPLYGVVTCPTFAADGSLVFENGYHAASGLWHHRTLTNLTAVPETPNVDAIATARGLLLDVLADFPFVDVASRANAVALMLLPFVRPLIAGPTPLHAVDAPSPATGKDLLVKSALLPALGREVGATTAAKDPDEWRKKITSALLSDSPAILWGNVAHRLDSEHLAAVLTDTVWRDRQLGHSRELQLPNRAVWTATGNNLAFSRELARRVVWIRLDACMEAPEQRMGFRHADLIAYVRQHRAELVHAALTIVRAWLAAGRPAGARVMGSFEAYVAVMGGILDVAEITGFLANADELRKRTDVETADWRAFVLAWWKRWQDTRVGVSDLATLLWEEGGKRTELLTSQVTAPTERGALTQLGLRLSRKRDCVIAGFRITPAEADNSGRLQYHLVPSDRIPFPEGMHEVCITTPDTNSSGNNGLQHSNGSTDDADLCIPLQTFPTKVCDANSSASHDLQENAYLCIPFPDPPRMHVRTCAHAHARAHEGTPGKRYAKVCNSAQATSPPQLESADLGADLGHTLSEQPKRSANRPPAAVDAVGFTGNGNPITQSTLDLAHRPDGWTPADWSDRLLQLAERCETLNPERAAELRQAAAWMSKSPEEHS